MKPYEKYVSKEAIQIIHEESLRILNEVGVKFEHPEILEIFKNHGARNRRKCRLFR